MLECLLLLYACVRRWHRTNFQYNFAADYTASELAARLLPALTPAIKVPSKPSVLLLS
jgi:hypothetical protein